MAMSNTSAFKPTLILHGGAGDIRRADLPPELYAKYEISLQSYLRSTKDLLNNDATALDAAVHAVSLMEDDELFNCGRGSVFTSAGSIEMEASVMVTSVEENEHNPNPNQNQGLMKRGSAVSGLRNVRHPIHLARESLLRTGYDVNGRPNGDGGSMHMQLAAPFVEERAKKWGLEFMPDEWFWTKARWEEHRRGLEGKDTAASSFPSVVAQGTVGCVCLDRWGGLAVATSTGGLTNKWPGRIGDTPSMGAGFWAEAWDFIDSAPSSSSRWRELDDMDQIGGETTGEPLLSSSQEPEQNNNMRSLFNGWMSSFVQKAVPNTNNTSTSTYTPLATTDTEQSTAQQQNRAYIPEESQTPPRRTKRRAVAMSGTGNGDSFLRIAAARTASAMLRFSPPSSSSSSPPMSLSKAITTIAGPNGELQSSAGKRWGVTGEGSGGIIGIEAEVEKNPTPAEDEDYPSPIADRYYDDSDEEDILDRRRRGKVVFDFNCGGMFRAWVEEDEDGVDVERVMVFREEY